MTDVNVKATVSTVLKEKQSKSGRVIPYNHHLFIPKGSVALQNTMAQFKTICNYNTTVFITF